MTLAKEIGRALAERPATRLIYGMATDVNTVALEGAATPVELPALRRVFAGDYVAVLESGSDRLIIGPINPGPRDAAIVFGSMAIPSGANTLINTFGVVQNPDPDWTTTATGITVPADDFYSCTLRIVWSGMATGQRIIGFLNLSVAYTFDIGVGPTSSPRLVVPGIDYLQAGQTVTVTLFHNAGAPRTASARLSVARMNRY